jgi:hypothetical protein
MRNTLLSFLILSLFIAVGCSKDKEEVPADPCSVKQLPGSYFPAFPKTWWTYRNQQNQLVEYKISDDYQSCKGKCSPVFLNLNVCVDGEYFVADANIGLGSVMTLASPVYSLILDSVFNCSVSFAAMGVNGYNTNTKRVTIASDTTVTLQNLQLYPNVIIVKEYNFDTSYFYCDYFAKNIGLIKRDSIHSADTTQILSIENYYIGH